MKAFIQNNRLFPDFLKPATCIILLFTALLYCGCDRTLIIEGSIFSPSFLPSIATNSQVLWVGFDKELYEVTIDGHVTNSWTMENVWGLAYGESKRYLLKNLDNETYAVCQWYDDGTMEQLFEINIPSLMLDLAVIDATIGIVDNFANVFYRFSMDGNLIDSFPLPMEFPKGIDFDGTYLWITDSNQIYQMDLKGRIKGQYVIKGTIFLYGLACDGDYLWVSATMSDLEHRILKLRKPVIGRLTDNTQNAILTFTSIAVAGDFLTY